MREKIDRLFIAEYENTKIWSGRTTAILSKIQPGDFYLIFKTGKGMVPSKPMAELVKSMADAKELYDVQGLNEENYKLFILDKINEFANNDTYVYFLSMETIYNQLKNNIKDVMDVQSSIDYKVGRRLKKTVMKNPTGRNVQNAKTSYSKENDNSDLFNSMVSIISDAPVVDVDKVPNLKDRIDEVAQETEEGAYKRNSDRKEISNLKENKIIYEENKSGNKKSVHKNPKAPKKDSSGDIVIDELDMMADALTDAETVLPIENREDNKKENFEKSSSNGNKKEDNAVPGKTKKTVKKKNNTKENEVVTAGPSINEIEKMIFGNKLTDGEFKKEYTDLDNEKAQMITALYDRLINNINKLIRNISTYEFNIAKYTELITVIIKSDDFEDFMKSWEVMEPGYPLLITEKIYMYIYDEAQYYSKVCEVLYGEDVW